MRAEGEKKRDHHACFSGLATSNFKLWFRNILCYYVNIVFIFIVTLSKKYTQKSSKTKVSSNYTRSLEYRVSPMTVDLAGCQTHDNVSGRVALLIFKAIG